QPPQDHAGMLTQGAGEAGPGKEFAGLAIILGCAAGHHLFEGDGELVRVEGAAFADFLPWGDGSVPGVHQWPPLARLRRRRAQPSPPLSRTSKRMRIRLCVTTINAPSRIASAWRSSSSLMAATFSSTRMSTKRMMQGWGKRRTKTSSPKSL